MAMKEEMMNKFIGLIYDKFEKSDIDTIRSCMLIAMEDYTVSPACTDIVEFKNSNPEILKAFIITKKVEGCTDRTIQYYRLTLEHFFRVIIAPVEQIQTNDIRLYLAKRAMADNVSTTTQDNELRILRSFFGWCTAEEFIQRDPTLKIKKIKTEKRIKKPFSEIEIERLRNGARDKRERAIIDILLSTGMRIGELHLLNKSDIDGDTLVVYGKGKKERYVYLNAKARVSLEEYLSTRDDDNDALFVSEQKPHNRLKISGFEIRLRELGHELGINSVHPHRFRRTAATLALNRGMPIEQVQQMLGHSEIGTTLIYAQSAQENLKMSHKKYVV